MKVADLSSLLLSLVSLLFSVTLGIYTWTRRHHKGAFPLAIILFCESFWILGFIFEMLAGSLEVRVFWDLFQWLFGPILALALFEVSSSFSEQSRFQKSIGYIFGAMMMAIILIVITNPLHHLVISNPQLISNGTRGLILYYEFSLVDYVIMVFIHLVTLVSFIKIILLPIWLQKIYRLQLLSLLTGFGLMFASSFLSLFEVMLFWGQRDISPVAFGLSNLILAWGLFRFHLFDIETVARNVVVDTIEYPMVVVDMFDKIVDLNNAARQYFGLSALNSKVLHKNDLVLKWSQLFDRFRTTPSFKGEISISFDDDPRILELTISPILSHGDLLSGRLFFIKDITEQKQAEELIRETEESYTRLFNTVKEAVYIQSQDGVFLNVNDGAVKMYGYAREEFIGRTPAFVSAVGKNDLQEISNMLDRVSRTGVAEEFEFWGKRQNGEEFPKECIANKGRYFGEDVIITTARDVTERKKAELELRQRTDDVELINKLNDALNHGESIEYVMKTLAMEIRRLFECNDVALNLFSDDEQFLNMQYTTLPTPLLEEIESIIQSPIPSIHIPIKETRLFQEIISSGRSLLISEPAVIQELIHDVSLSTTFSHLDRSLVNMLLPQITALLNIRSTILVPLISNGKTIGVLDLVSQHEFTESDLRRVENFSRQITVAIQHRQAEEAVRAKEELFRRVITATPDAVLGVDADGKIAFANEEATTLFGYLQNELINSGVDMLVPSRLRNVHTVKRGEYVVRPHVRHMGALMEPVAVRKDGTEIPVDIKLGYSSSGSELLVIAYIRDITERRRAENALRERESKFRSVIEHASDGIALMDNKGSLIEWNPTMEQITGLKHSETIGRPVWEVVFEMMPREKRTAEFQRINADRWMAEVRDGYVHKDHLMEYPIEDTQGHRKIIQSNGFSVETAQGLIGGVIMRDITARKQAEAALQESEKRFHLLFDTAMDGIIFTMPDGSIHSANPAALALFGYTETEMMALNARDLVDFSDAVLLAALEERNRVGFAKSEFTAIRKDGSKFLIEINSVLFQQDGILASNFFRDITERKMAESERARLVAELKNKNDELEKFSYTVSHDLKAPLFTIQGFVGYLERDIHANDPARIQNDIDRITSAIDKMQRLLSEILELSRIGRNMNSPQEVSLGVIANDALSLLTGHIAEKRVIVDVAPDLPVVYCDRTRMTQVMQNLIHNAIKFMGTQPEPRIWIRQRPEPQETVFYIQDNGMGIPPEQQARIFGLFDKLDAKADGTGVGLALVKRIIETHGGKIWVESQGRGEGSTFCFTLPHRGKSEHTGSVQVQ